MARSTAIVCTLDKLKRDYFFDYHGYNFCNLLALVRHISDSETLIMLVATSLHFYMNI